MESIIHDDFPEDNALFEVDDSRISHPFLFQPFRGNDETMASPSSKSQSMGNPGRPLNPYSTLSGSEERRLRDIAMPDYVIERMTKKAEGDSLVPIAIKPKRRVKRKLSTTKEEQTDLCQHRKQSHNAIEKRYRMNLNDKIDLLRQSLPITQNTPRASGEGDEEEARQEAGLISDSKSGKAAVLTGAVAYISQLESNTKRLAIETGAMKARLEAFKKLAMSGSIFSGRDICWNMRISKPSSLFRLVNIALV
jgi:hypothetical protein